MDGVVKMFLVGMLTVGSAVLPSLPSSPRSDAVASVDLSSILEQEDVSVTDEALAKAISVLEDKYDALEKRVAELEKPKVAAKVEAPKVAESPKPVYMTSYGIPLGEGEVLVAIDGVPVSGGVRAPLRQAVSAVARPVVQASSNVSGQCYTLPNGRMVCPNRQ